MQRRWSSAARSQALEIAAAEGSRRASEKTGIPIGTVKSWKVRAARSARYAVERAPQPLVAVEVDRTEQWSERRPRLVEELGIVSEEALAAVREAIAAGRLRDAKDGSIAIAVLVDKALLLSGQATRRTEAFTVRADLEADIARLRSELDELPALEAGES